MTMYSTSWGSQAVLASAQLRGWRPRRKDSAAHAKGMFLVTLMHFPMASQASLVMQPGEERLPTSFRLVVLFLRVHSVLMLPSCAPVSWV
jgi:hypothetical protein